MPEKDEHVRVFIFFHKNGKQLERRTENQEAGNNPGRTENGQEKINAKKHVAVSDHGEQWLRINCL